MTTPPPPSQQATRPSTPCDAQRPWPLRAEADYEYHAADDEEVSFHKHDLLQVIEITGRWWKVKTPAGQFGLAPSNHITLLPSISPDDMPKEDAKVIELDPLTEKKSLQATTAGFESNSERSQLEQRGSAPKARVGYLWQNDKALAKLEGRRPPRFKPLRRLLDEIRRFARQVQVAYECTMQLQASKTTHDIAMYVGT
ncbi:hypothetical protein KC340_g17882 [Hortaea werneckii]|nr:hypothetical protein KC342_g15222 [Hortaea werneckii]KAI7064374.1 hypothetical protein KC339_g16077 [Hortaea werneckii]KAI7213794.1 hypothetical protein KC365_g14147 [Hortaea werneckii]KAI7288827.1 hypothetical protein KC340_g17882 [Hortaea werneckii]KAI7381329.1 hypothetical protein KC328_g12302 [Hortaea werneckii]